MAGRLGVRGVNESYRIELNLQTGYDLRMTQRKAEAEIETAVQLGAHLPAFHVVQRRTAPSQYRLSNAAGCLIAGGYGSNYMM